MLDHGFNITVLRVNEIENSISVTKILNKKIVYKNSVKKEVWYYKHKGHYLHQRVSMLGYNKVNTLLKTFKIYSSPKTVGLGMVLYKSNYLSQMSSRTQACRTVMHVAKRVCLLLSLVCSIWKYTSILLLVILEISLTRLEKESIDFIIIPKFLRLTIFTAAN